VKDEVKIKKMALFDVGLDITFHSRNTENQFLNSIHANKLYGNIQNQFLKSIVDKKFT